MSREAFNRVFNSQMTPKNASLFSSVGECLADELLDFKITQDSISGRLGLALPMDEVQREEKKKQFNKEIAEVTQGWIKHPHKPIPLSKVSWLQISPLDLVLMQRLGILGK